MENNQAKITKHYKIEEKLAEDVVWRKDIKPLVKDFSQNLIDLWHYSFTEMFNNAIDHSQGTKIEVLITQKPDSTEMIIVDDGIGIFKKIKEALDLEDERHAVLELTKGKLTTDPTRHSGEGIFFTSRVVDFFSIHSGRIFFTHKFGEEEDYIVTVKEQQFRTGTAICLDVKNKLFRTVGEITSKYSSGDDLGFNKTVVPVFLAQYGEDKLVSRSQAKRLLAELNKFKKIILDFKGVETIGQAFADEIFRVFPLNNPGTEILQINGNDEVQKMIQWVKANI